MPWLRGVGHRNRFGNRAVHLAARDREAPAWGIWLSPLGIWPSAHRPGVARGHEAETACVVKRLR